MDMKEVIFNKKDYKSYKDFYEDVCIKLGTNEFIDWEGDINLNYDGNNLNEFLWYCHNDNLKIVFLGFDVEKIKLEKTLDDYHYAIVFRVFNRFINEYPNNSVEFRNE